MQRSVLRLPARAGQVRDAKTVGEAQVSKTTHSDQYLSTWSTTTTTTTKTTMDGWMTDDGHERDWT